MSLTVAIVGRPNVGKSTLFNRLIGQRKSIVDNVSGVTRDRIYGFSHWNGRDFTVIDTGGFVKGSDDIFESAIRAQVNLAIEEADVIIFMTDVTTGITDLDESIARMLRKSTKKVILSVNKVDNNARLLNANEFWSLGFENTLFLSSITGSGSGEVLDMLIDLFPSDQVVKPKNDFPNLAIVGRPNVGKSSMVNALLGEERNIVTDIAGTTRDSIHSVYSKYGMDFNLVDTAGIRKKRKVHEDLEFYSVIRAVKSIDDADVCLLLIDATQGIEAQDLSIMSLIHKRKKGLVIVVNKWDLVANKETNSARDYAAAIQHKISPFKDVPIVFTSVLEKQRIFKVMEKAKEVWVNRSRKISTSVLNNVMQEVIERTPPPSHRGKFIKIKYIMQLPTFHPAFAFFCNHPKHVKESYRHFLENKLRENFEFSGVPISVFFREK